MHLFRLARNPTQWLRVALVAFVLGFALNSIAHASHTHDATAPTHQLSCGYCVHLGALADAPKHVPGLSLNPSTHHPASDLNAFVRSGVSELAARPRGPPVS